MSKYADRRLNLLKSISFSKLEREILGEGDDKPKPYFDDKNDKKSQESYLFASFRYDYLDKMAPFQVEITSKLYEACLENYTAKETFRTNEDADFVLKKLQAVLSSQIVSKQVIGEVNAFLSLNENLRGSLSLQSIIMNTNDAVQLLIDACPQCLLQFGKVDFIFGLKIRCPVSVCLSVCLLSVRIFITHRLFLHRIRYYICGV